MIGKYINLLCANREKLTVLADQALVSGVNFAVGILLARAMGVEQYGLFALAWMVVLFASGVQQALVIAPLYALTARQENPDQWINRVFTLQLFLSVVAFGVVFLIVFVAVQFQPEWYTPGLDWVLGATVAIYLLNDFLRRTLFVRHRPLRVLLMDLFGFGLQPFLIGFLHEAALLSISSSVGVVLIAQTLSLVVALWNARPGLVVKGLNELLAHLWQYSRYLVGTSLLQWFSGNYFVLAAGALLGPAAVGAVRIAQNIMGLLHVLFQAMENIVPVRAAEALHRGGNAAMMTYMRHVAIQALLPTGLLLGALAVFREVIIDFIYGAEYLPYSDLLLAFCGIYVLVFFGTLMRFVIRTIERNHIIFWSYVLTTAFSLLMATPMVDKLGVTGVVLGIALTHIISLTLFTYLLKSSVSWTSKSST